MKPKDYLAFVSLYGYYTPFYIGRKRGYNRDNKNFQVQKKIPHHLVRDFKDDTVRSLITTVISDGEKKVEISEPLPPSLMAEVWLS